MRDLGSVPRCLRGGVYVNLQQRCCCKLYSVARSKILPWPVSDTDIWQHQVHTQSKTRSNYQSTVQFTSPVQSPVFMITRCHLCDKQFSSYYISQQHQRAVTKTREGDVRNPTNLVVHWVTILGWGPMKEDGTVTKMVHSHTREKSLQLMRSKKKTKKKRKQEEKEKQ